MGGIFSHIEQKHFIQRTADSKDEKYATVTCPDCQGTGTWEDVGFRGRKAGGECPTCQGTGKVRRLIPIEKQR